MATTPIQYNVSDFKPDVAVGIKLPFVRKDGILFDQSYSTQEQLLSNLKNLILTEPGERVFQPQFGTVLRETLFEPNIEDTRSRLRSNIEFAIGFWLPYIRIIKLEIEPVSVTSNKVQDEHGVIIDLIVQISNRSSEIPVTFAVTPSGVYFEN